MSPALTGSSESVSSQPGGSAAGGAQAVQQQLSQVSCDRQFVTIVTEKQARVIALPSQNCVYKHQIADADFVVKSEVISMKGKRASPSPQPSPARALAATCSRQVFLETMSLAPVGHVSSSSQIGENAPGPATSPIVG